MLVFRSRSRKIRRDSTLVLCIILLLFNVRDSAASWSQMEIEFLEFARTSALVHSHFYIIVAEQQMRRAPTYTLVCRIARKNLDWNAHAQIIILERLMQNYVLMHLETRAKYQSTREERFDPCKIIALLGHFSESKIVSKAQEFWSTSMLVATFVLLGTNTTSGRPKSQRVKLKRNKHEITGETKLDSILLVIRSPAQQSGTKNELTINNLVIHAQATVAKIQSAETTKAHAN